MKQTRYIPQPLDLFAIRTETDGVPVTIYDLQIHFYITHDGNYTNLVHYIPHPEVNRMLRFKLDNPLPFKLKPTITPRLSPDNLPYPYPTKDIPFYELHAFADAVNAADLTKTLTKDEITQLHKIIELGFRNQNGLNAATDEYRRGFITENAFVADMEYQLRQFIFDAEYTVNGYDDEEMFNEDWNYNNYSNEAVNCLAREFYNAIGIPEDNLIYRRKFSHAVADYVPRAAYNTPPLPSITRKTAPYSVAPQ